MNEFRFKLKLQRERQMQELAVEALRNPIVDLVAAYFILEWAMRKEYIGTTMGTALESALAGGEVIKAMGSAGLFDRIGEALKSLPAIMAAAK